MVSAAPVWFTMLVQFVVAMVATISFGITFQVGRRHYWTCGFVGAVGWTIYIACTALGGMTAPMAVFAFIAWLRNPYNGNKAEVKVNRLGGREIAFMTILTAFVTFAFYFILEAFHTANLIPSTISVTTSFLAVYLTFRRSAYFALAYAANDVVLIVLWVLAAMEDISYFSVMLCFVMFLVNDVYGFISWQKRHRRQQSNKAPHIAQAG